MLFKNIIFSLIISGIIVLPLQSFSESQTFTVASRNYLDLPIALNQGDQISFSILVNGGTSDDIYFTLYSPDGSKLVDGRIVEQHSNNISAGFSGTYTFRFDNTGSTISNKSINFSYQIQKNTYYVYVDKIPEWTNYAGNSVYDSTEAWKKANPNLNFYQAKSPEEANLRVQWVKEFGVEHVGYAYDSHFIEVGLGDSNCLGNWHPFSANHVNWIMTHEIGHILGLDHSSDPSSIMYPTAPRAQYGLIEEQYTLSKGYLQFIPFCASKDITTFSYSVSTDDSTYGFDVYVVPSVKEMDNAVKGNSFAHYSSSECYGENYLSYSGTCSGVSQSSGLLIVMDNRQTNGLTEITVKQLETDQTVNKLQSVKTATISYEYPDEYTQNQQAQNDAFSQAQNSLEKYLQAESEKKSLESILNQAEINTQMKIDAIATAYEKKSFNRKMIDYFDAEISKVANSLNGVSYENQQAQKKIEQAWEEKGMAESDLRNAEKIWLMGERSLTNKDESKAISYFDNIQSIIESGEEHLNSSILLLDSAKNIALNQKPKTTCGAGTELVNGVCQVTVTEKLSQGDCLIATASYGSELAPQVQMLREIRDNTLLNTESGKTFMSGFNTVYYSFSPTIAQWENDNLIFKEFVKLFITPMISTLSIMTLIDNDSELQVILFGISTIGLIVGMYVVAPIVAVNYAWRKRK